MLLGCYFVLAVGRPFVESNQRKTRSCFTEWGVNRRLIGSCYEIQDNDMVSASMQQTAYQTKEDLICLKTRVVD